jgi:integrase
LTKLGLTNLYLASLPAAPPGKRQIIWDGVQPNFGIRTTEHGVKSFVVAKRPEGSAKLTMVVLGKYTGRPGGLSLAEARRKAQEVLATLATGVTPAQARVQEQAAQEAQQRRLFATVAEAYIAEYLPRLRSSRSVEARIRNKLLSRWSDRPIAEIGRRDVVQMVKEISAADGPEAARSALRAASGLFSWVADQACYGLDLNPCAGRWNKVLQEAQPQHRALSDAELLQVWRAAEQLGYPFSAVYKLLILTGQRRGEITNLRWCEINLDTAELTIPVARMKNKKAHTLPLAPMALGLLQSLPRWSAEDFCFSTTGGRSPVAGFHRVKQRIGAVANIAPWRTHDLRHSMRSGLSRVGVRPVVAEMCLGHLQKGIASVYDHHDFAAEMRDALQRWEGHVAGLLAGGFTTSTKERT